MREVPSTGQRPVPRGRTSPGRSVSGSRRAIVSAKTRATPSAPSMHPSQNQPLGISTGALISRMSAAARELVARLLVADDGAGRMTAEVFVFIFIHDDGAFPAFQKIGPARWR